MAEDLPQTASNPLHMQPTDAGRARATKSTPADDISHLGPPKLSPIQHVRGRTKKREEQLTPRPDSYVNPPNSSKPGPSLRKQSEPTPLLRTSRAPSESAQIMLDHRSASLLQTPRRNRSDKVIKKTETSIDTPLSTGGLSNFRQSDMSPHASVSNHPNDESGTTEHRVPSADRKIYDAEKLKVQKDFARELTAVWLGEMIAHAIIGYYQGQRDDLIEGLTHATCLAAEYDLKELMGRAQLWKAIIFDEMGNTANIALILSDVLPLVRDFGDEMDCYQLRKLLLIYGFEIFRHCMIQAGQKQAIGTDSDLNSPASQGAFGTWFSRQMLTLEEKSNHRNWPDPLMARDAAHVSAKLTNANLPSRKKSKAGHLIPQSKVTAGGPSISGGNAALLENILHLEDTLKAEREESRITELELSAKIERLEAVVNDLQGNDSLSKHRRAAGAASISDAEPPKAVPPAISPGQITALNEILKAARPRSRQTAPSHEREGIALNLPHEENSSVLRALQIERWLQEHRRHSTSSASSQRDAWGTPTHARSLFDREKSNSMASFVDGHMDFIGFDVPRPQPLNIRNLNRSPPSATSSQGQGRKARSRARSRLQRSLDERRIESRSARRRASKAVGSANWRNSERQSLPKAASSAGAGSHEIRAVEDGALLSSVPGRSELSQNLPAVMTGICSRPLPQLDTSGGLHRNENFDEADQTRHNVPEAPPGPRLYPRRGSAPSSALVSPLTIDPGVELPLTDTPSPTKLKHTISAFRDHQEKRRRSASVSISPTSMSYETERRRSHAAAGMKVQEDRENNESSLSIVPQDPDQSASNKVGRSAGQVFTGRVKHIQSTSAVRTNALGNNESNAESQNAFPSSGGVQTSTSDGKESSNSTSTSSNKLFLGKRGISVGHGTAITGLSSDLSKLAQESQSTTTVKDAEEAIFGGQEDIHASQVGTLGSDLYPNQNNSSQQAQPTILSVTKDADVDNIAFSRMHHRQGSVPVVPSPLREASRADDLEDPVKKPKKQESQEIKAGNDQTQPEFVWPHVSVGERLVTDDKPRQLSIRDFAYDQSSETSDLYGVSDGSLPETVDRSLSLNPSDREPAISVDSTNQATSPVRLSKLYEDIENAYPSPIVANDGTRSTSIASTTDSWPLHGSVRMSAVPRLDIDRLLRQRQKHREQEQQEEDEEDEAVSPTTRPVDRPKTNTPPKKTNQDQQDAIREIVLNIASQPDLEDKFEADVVVTHLEAANIEEDEEDEELSDEDIYSDFSNNKDISPKSTVDGNQTPTLHEPDIPTPPRTTMDEFPEDDADIENLAEPVEERGSDGDLEFLLPTTYVPLSQQSEERSEIEEEMLSEREDMQKEMWSEGII